MLNRRALLAAPLVLAAPRAFAQESFPNRTVRLVVPYAPGGAVDITARMLAEKLQPVLGQTVIVDNRGGAGGNLGADVVAKADKDGYTLLLASASILCGNKYLYRKSMPFEPLRDLAPVTRVTTGTVLLAVNAKKPWRTFQELIAAAKKDPGGLTMGSSGTGTVSHLALEKVKRAAGIDITHVPYRGGGPAIQDLLAGNIDMMFDVMPAIIPHVKEGRFRALAVGSAERVTYVPELKDVPGMAELLPGSGIDMQSWYAIVVPTGTPADRIGKLHDAILPAVRSDDFRSRIEPMGFTPVSDDTPADFGAYWRSQEAVWKDLVEVSGASLD